MAKMKTYTLEELEDKYIGEIGTPERDEYEKKLEAEIKAYHIGEAIKQARLAKNLTQEELGERVGVQKAQISRLERGKSITIASLMRLFTALEVPLSLEMGGIGKISLC